MKSSFKALERELILERTEIALTDALGQLMEKWEHAGSDKDSRPSAFDLIDALHRNGVATLQSLPRAMNYVDQCAAQGAAPDMARIFRILLPEAPVPPFLEPDDSDHLFPDEKPC